MWGLLETCHRKTAPVPAYERASYVWITYFFGRESREIHLWVLRNTSPETHQKEAKKTHIFRSFWLLSGRDHFLESA